MKPHVARFGAQLPLALDQVASGHKVVSSSVSVDPRSHHASRPLPDKNGDWSRPRKCERSASGVSTTSGAGAPSAAGRRRRAVNWRAICLVSGHHGQPQHKSNKFVPNASLPTYLESMAPHSRSFFCCVWFVVRSNLRVEVSSNQHVCVFVFCRCLFGPQ